MNTLEEWAEYIGQLRGSVLRSKAIAANSMTFVRQMQSDGFDLEFIHGIMLLFAKQFSATGQVPPVGGVEDLVELMETDPKAIKARDTSLEGVEVDPDLGQPDDIDKAEDGSPKEVREG